MKKVRIIALIIAAVMMLSVLAMLAYADEKEVILDVSSLLPEGGEQTTILYGDVNGDGKVNTKDDAALARYLAKWTGYDDTTVNTEAADVNGDGKVNAKDNAVLARYLAKWTGYDTLPHVE